MDSEQQRNAVSRVDEPQQGDLALEASAMPEALIADDEPNAPGDWLGTTTSTLSAIERLKTTIDEETEKLEIRAATDFDGFSRRKNRGLLELTRAVRLAENGGVDPRLVPELTRLRASLVRNQAALQIHLDAVREVSAIIAKSIQEVESDGTYSLTGPRR
uniref:Flagellar biosynthesis protein FlgN n=1 Tax=Rhodopseudomonas palustris (strain BisA53) TaxID=316055 RepID=Q07SE9_RHOP5